MLSFTLANRVHQVSVTKGYDQGLCANSVLAVQAIYEGSAIPFACSAVLATAIYAGDIDFVVTAVPNQFTARNRTHLTFTLGASTLKDQHT